MIGTHIKEARKAKGMSQEELANCCHVVRQTVSKWENQLSQPDADTLIQIAKCLDVPVEKLLGMASYTKTLEEWEAEDKRLHEELEKQQRAQMRYVQANKKREAILFLSFLCMVMMLMMKNTYLSFMLTSVFILIMLAILYRNLPLLCDGIEKQNVIKWTTLFDLGILTLTVIVVGLNKAEMIQISEGDDRFLAMALVSLVILFSGVICPRLPFNRYTGLRLPWTVQDEKTWNVAHRIVGMVSWPLVLLYVAGTFTIPDFQSVSLVIIALWIGLPGGISLIFWIKRFKHR